VPWPGARPLRWAGLSLSLLALVVSWRWVGLPLSLLALVVSWRWAGLSLSLLALVVSWRWAAVCQSRLPLARVFQRLAALGQKPVSCRVLPWTPHRYKPSATPRPAAMQTIPSVGVCSCSSVSPASSIFFHSAAQQSRYVMVHCLSRILSSGGPVEKAFVSVLMTRMWRSGLNEVSITPAV